VDEEKRDKRYWISMPSSMSQYAKEVQLGELNSEGYSRHSSSQNTKEGPVLLNMSGRSEGEAVYRGLRSVRGLHRNVRERTIY